MTMNEERTLKLIKPDPNMKVSDIPPRPWVLGKRLLRGYASGIVSAGGTGKSMLTLVTLASIATGRKLTGEYIHESGPVWLISCEDNLNEMYRRLWAISQAYKIQWAELVENIRITDCYTAPLRLVERMQFNGEVGMYPTPIVEVVIATAKAEGIIAIAVDPLIKTATGGSENDNNFMDFIAQQYTGIAGKANVAMLVVHHIRKGKPGEISAGDADMARGATALVDALRVVHTLVRKDPDEGLDKDLTKRLVRLDSAKSNFALPDKKARWFYMQSESLANAPPGSGDR